MSASEKSRRSEPQTLPPDHLRDWCVQNGIATADEIDASLKIQRSVQVSGKPPPRLEDILVARGILTPNQVAKASAAAAMTRVPCESCFARFTGSGGSTSRRLIRSAVIAAAILFTLGTLLFFLARRPF